MGQERSCSRPNGRSRQNEFESVEEDGRDDCEQSDASHFKDFMDKSRACSSSPVSDSFGRGRACSIGFEKFKYGNGANRSIIF